MRKRKSMNQILVTVICLGLTGCASLTVGIGDNPPQVRSQGLLNSYLACNGFRPYDGTFIDVGILSDNDRWGSIASLDIWPIGGMGVSFAGARMKLLPFEMGFGVLGYEPEPECYKKSKEKPACDVEAIESTEEESVWSRLDLKQLSDDQRRQLLAWLDSSVTPYEEFNRLGSENDRLTVLHHLFVRNGSDAAKPYLARSFLQLSASDENWPPAEAHFTWIVRAFKEAEALNLLKEIAREKADESDNARIEATCARVISAGDEHAQISPLFDGALHHTSSSKERGQILAWKARCHDLSSRRLSRGEDAARKAIALYDESLDLNPDTDTTWRYISLLGNQHKEEKLNEFLPTAMDWFPQEVYVTHKEAGRAYMDMGEYDEAEVHFVKSLELLPKGYEWWTVSLRLPLTEIYSRRGEPERAKETAREALLHAIRLGASQSRLEGYYRELSRHVDLSNISYESLHEEVERSTTLNR